MASFASSTARRALAVNSNAFKLWPVGNSQSPPSSATSSQHSPQTWGSFVASASLVHFACSFVAGPACSAYCAGFFEAGLACSVCCVGSFVAGATYSVHCLGSFEACLLPSASVLSSVSESSESSRNSSSSTLIFAALAASVLCLAR